MLRPSISYDLPVVNALRKGFAAEEIPEDVIIFLNVNLPAIVADLKVILHLLLPGNLGQNSFTVPGEMGDDHTDDLSLVSQ